MLLAYYNLIPYVPYPPNIKRHFDILGEKRILNIRNSRYERILSIDNEKRFLIIKNQLRFLDILNQDRLLKISRETRIFPFIK
jgi:hypothetical protein